jgi:tRNA(fMet)-specific endonuclease VapC
VSYLVDTDVVIDALRDRPQAVSIFQRLVPAGVAISIISVGELYDGAFMSAHPRTHLGEIRRFVHGFRIIGLDDAVMETFARERAALRRRGLLIPDLDLLIAATAKQHGLILATRNSRHFDRVEDLALEPV